MRLRSRFLLAGMCCIAGTLADSRVQAQAPEATQAPQALEAAPATQAAQAPQAPTVTNVKKVVEKQSNGAGPWSRVEKATVLAQGDALRTGKRSQAEVKFADNSTVRMGQLTSLQIRMSTPQSTVVLLQDGHILLVKNTGNSQIRVLTSSGFAEIKSGSAFIQQNPDGSTEYSLYSGAMSVGGVDAETNQSRSIDLPVGKSVRTTLGRTLSEITSAPPLGSRGDVN